MTEPKDTTNRGVRPLDGVRILAAEHMLAAPYATMLMADMGAEVIKVEEPRSGDMARRIGPFLNAPNGETVAGLFVRGNRNKKSITLDLKSDRGRALFLALAKKSDVVAENMRAGVMERLGLGYADLAPENQALIYLSVSGFGHNSKFDSPYRDWPAYGPLAEAWAGITDRVSMPDGRPPADLGFQLGDVYTSVVAALGLMMALRYRDLTGLGQYVDISLYDCLLTLMERPVVHYSMTGEVPRRDRPGTAPSGPFRCQDGYVTISGVTNEDWLRLCRAIGRPDLAERDDLAQVAGRQDALDEVIRPAIEAWTGKRPKMEAARELVAGNVPAAPVHTLAELADCDHVRAHNMLVEVQSAAGKVTMVGNPIKLTRVDESFQGPPSFGQHTSEVLQSMLGLSGDEIAELRETGIV